MKKPTFQSRVNAVVKSADLTIADLQAWFKRPYPTVWRWVNSGWVPRGPDGRRAEKDLALLEKVAARKQPPMFPIPTYVESRKRRDYVREVYHAEHARLSAAGAAK